MENKELTFLGKVWPKGQNPLVPNPGNWNKRKNIPWGLTFFWPIQIGIKRRESERYLKNLFQTKQIEKSYLAWVNGRVEREFTIEEPIAVRRDYTSSKHKVEISKYGKFAKTIFRPKFYNESLDSSLIECFPITGRTHQIRVHLYHIGYPIIGDPIYGVSNSIAQRYLDDELSQYERVEATGAKRLMLHANSLQFKYKNIYKIYSKMEFKCEI